MRNLFEYELISTNKCQVEYFIGLTKIMDKFAIETA